MKPPVSAQVAMRIGIGASPGLARYGLASTWATKRVTSNTMARNSLNAFIQLERLERLELMERVRLFCPRPSRIRNVDHLIVRPNAFNFKIGLRLRRIRVLHFVSLVQSFSAKLLHARDK